MLNSGKMEVHSLEACIILLFGSINMIGGGVG